LHTMARWLKACGVTTVAMETTGVYWIPPYDILEAHGIKPCLTNARHMKNVAPPLKQNPEKCVLLMDGYDLRCVLAMEADLRELLMAKLAFLNLDAEPYLGAKAFLERADD